MHCDSQFVLDMFWDVGPVQCLMQQVWEAVVELACASDETRCSVQYTLQLVSNASWWSGKNGTAGTVITPCVCVYVCLSVHKTTHESIDECRPNLVAWADSDPLEIIKCCCWSDSGCGSTITFQLLWTLWDTAFYDICSLTRGHHLTSLWHWVPLLDTI